LTFLPLVHTEEIIGLLRVATDSSWALIAMLAIGAWHRCLASFIGPGRAV
jgi:hypothetical protein